MEDITETLELVPASSGTTNAVLTTVAACAAGFVVGQVVVKLLKKRWANKTVAETDPAV
jgi:hypothetical protein